MGVTFLYPSGDLSNIGSWTSTGSNLWSVVDEGVATANDADFITNSEVYNGTGKELKFTSLPQFINFNGITNASGHFRFKNDTFITPSAVDVRMILNDSVGGLIASGQFSENISGDWGTFNKSLTVFNTNPIGNDPELNIQFGSETNPSGLNGLDLSAFDIQVESTGSILKVGATMSMFISVKELSSSSGNILGLYTKGTPVGTGNLFEETTLFIDGGNTPSGLMNLHVGGWADPEQTTATMPMFIGDPTNSAFSGWEYKLTTLFIENNTLSDSSGITMFIEGPVGNSGWIPNSGSMSLFINRQFESTAHRMPLYIGGPLQTNDNTPLYISGSNVPPSSISLFIQADAQPNNSTIELYSHGF